MHEHDPERKADDGAEPEADDRFLGGEERLVQQHGDQRRLVDLHRLSERLEDRPQVRHRGRVDDERPAPSGRRPDPPIQLPEAGEREDDRGNGCDSAGDPRRLPRAQRTARGRAGDGGGGHRLLLITYFVGSIAMALDPSRTVAELKELRELTADENGAQRVAWTHTWELAREWLRGNVATRTASRCPTLSPSTVSTSTARSTRAGSSRTPPPISSCTSSRVPCSSRSTCRSAWCSVPSASSGI